ncbi:MAG TPA: hypothetical protein VE400_00025 [Mycobacterium sp.]|jgi:hypothetical protein|nr:hypothetical protein [Mycobacterium sp.]
MNTSTNTNQTYDTMKITMRTTPTGFGRHTMAGALLAMSGGRRRSRCWIGARFRCDWY